MTKWTFQCGAPASVCTDCGDDTEDEAVFVKGTDHLCCQCAKVGMNIYCDDIDEMNRELEAKDEEVTKLREAFAKYACHVNGPGGMCEALKHSDYPCTCGLNELLEALEKEDSE